MNHGPDDPEWEAKQADRRAEHKRAEKRGDNVRSIGEAKGARVVKTYDYLNLKGGLIYQVCRMEPKSFRQRRPHPLNPEAWVWKMKAGEDANGPFPEQKTTLYRIPELFAALEAGDDVWICEGEKDADTMFDRELVSTCNTGGAGKFRGEMAAPFSKAQPGSTIAIVQDRDEAGERHARQVYDFIKDVIQEGVNLRIVEPLAGKDATDHFEAGHGEKDFAFVWPVSEEMLQTAPAAYKRSVLRQAMTMTDGALRVAGNEERPHDPPKFRLPLIGSKKIPHLQGVVTIAGGPSTGKSYLAISCGIDNALDPLEPWDVFYLACEMPDVYIVDRALRAASSINMTAYECRDARHRQNAEAWATDTAMPTRFVRVQVDIGVTMPEVIEMLADNVSDRPTMVIMDSISSLVDNMDHVQGDAFGMTNLKDVQKYACAVRRMTQGHVAFLILSEINKEGKAKGRSLDHRSDLAISMVKDEEQTQIKKITATKSWYCEDGPLGDFVLYPDIARLVRVDTGEPS